MQMTCPVFVASQPRGQGLDLVPHRLLHKHTLPLPTLIRTIDRHCRQALPQRIAGAHALHRLGTVEDRPRKVLEQQALVVTDKAQLSLESVVPQDLCRLGTDEPEPAVYAAQRVSWLAHVVLLVHRMLEPLAVRVLRVVQHHVRLDVGAALRWYHAHLALRAEDAMAPGLRACAQRRQT